MSLCPTCPRCNSFAGFIVSESNSYERDKYEIWPGEGERGHRERVIRKCDMGHIVSSRDIVWK